MAANDTRNQIHGPVVIPCDFTPHHPGLYGRYLPIDLDANNRHSIEAAATRRGITVQELLELIGRQNGTPPGFGWGVCRHGFGLQDLPYMDEAAAEATARNLNRLDRTDES